MCVVLVLRCVEMFFGVFWCEGVGIDVCVVDVCDDGVGI